MTVRCPGQDMSRWTPADIYEIQCPYCQTDIEFFKDEPYLPCPGCRREVRNAKLDLGCAAWCEAAPACLGRMPDDPDEIGSLCDRLVLAIEGLAGASQERIDHVCAVLSSAEAILERDREAAPLIVKAAAILHEMDERADDQGVGRKPDEGRHRESSTKARTMLERLGVDRPTVDEVCRILRAWNNEEIDSREIRILRDAHWLATLPDTSLRMNYGELTGLIQRVFRTDAGRALARERFLSEPPPGPA